MTTTHLCGKMTITEEEPAKTIGGGTTGIPMAGGEEVVDDKAGVLPEQPITTTPSEGPTATYKNDKVYHYAI